LLRLRPSLIAQFFLADAFIFALWYFYSGMAPQGLLFAADMWRVVVALLVLVDIWKSELAWEKGRPVRRSEIGVSARLSRRRQRPLPAAL
jgi:hypothetical protein